MIDLAEAAGRRRGSTSAGRSEITHIRCGEQLFHSANITFQRQFACATCHPDGHVDGLTYDIEADGIGVSPVDNRTLRGIYDTDPFKWEGTNPTLARQCGARLAVFFTRLAPFTPEELARRRTTTSVTIPRPPNRYRPLGAQLTRGPAPGQGDLRADRAPTTAARSRPRAAASSATSPPLLHRPPAARRRHEARDSTAQGKFDVPHLNNIYDSAPYLHNGMADTLEEIWTVHNPYDTHGVHQRHDQGPAQRPDRVPEDALSEGRKR